MAQFKVGDKVRVKYKDKDNEGVIVCIQYNGDKIVYCSIRCLEPYYVSTGIENIELIPPLKTADEMLAELGWNPKIYLNERYPPNTVIHYSKKDDFMNYVISIWLNDKYYTVYQEESGDTYDIDIQLHKAIHKKLEELGWL